ncbi:unnamed protein product [marine sediment metagenome]|uniref:Uncharacterized protein n=1 Tax=marine sediment metagenome TaxID=412755 RepID=X1AT96_9ZZZZ
MIVGGYYIKARCIQNSEIAHAPPHIREIWDYLLREANHKDVKHNGKIIKRGQCVRRYEDILKSLHWMVGWRKQSYSKSQCETAMKWLKKRGMITTKKTIRGMTITICNYDYYQTAENYENHNSTRMKTTVKPQSNHTINKNEENEKNERKKNNYPPVFLKENDTPKRDSVFADKIRAEVEQLSKGKNNDFS